MMPRAPRPQSRPQRKRNSTAMTSTGREPSPGTSRGALTPLKVGFADLNEADRIHSLQAYLENEHVRTGGGPGGSAEIAPPSTDFGTSVRFGTLLREVQESASNAVLPRDDLPPLPPQAAADIETGECEAAATVEPQLCYAHGRGLKGGREGDTLEFVVYTVDSHGRSMQEGGLKLFVYLERQLLPGEQQQQQQQPHEPAGGEAEDAYVPDMVPTPPIVPILQGDGMRDSDRIEPRPAIQDNGNGTYLVRYMRTTPGFYLLYVLIEDTVSNPPVPLPGFPFGIAIEPGEAFASISQLCLPEGTVPPTFSVDGHPQEVYIEARDRFGNPLQRGGDPFGVRGVGPMRIIRNIDNENGTYTISFCALPEYGCAFLKCVLHILLHGEHIRGSPLVLTPDRPPPPHIPPPEGARLKILGFDEALHDLKTNPSWQRRQQPHPGRQVRSREAEEMDRLARSAHGIEASRQGYAYRYARSAALADVIHHNYWRAIREKDKALVQEHHLQRLTHRVGELQRDLESEYQSLLGGSPATAVTQPSLPAELRKTPREPPPSFTPQPRHGMPDPHMTPRLQGPRGLPSVRMTPSLPPSHLHTRSPHALERATAPPTAQQLSFGPPSSPGPAPQLSPGRPYRGGRRQIRRRRTTAGRVSTLGGREVERERRRREDAAVTIQRVQRGRAARRKVEDMRMGAFELRWPPPPGRPFRFAIPSPPLSPPLLPAAQAPLAASALLPPPPPPPTLPQITRRGGSTLRVLFAHYGVSIEDISWIDEEALLKMCDDGQLCATHRDQLRNQLAADAAARNQTAVMSFASFKDALAVVASIENPSNDPISSQKQLFTTKLLPLARQVRATAAAAAAAEKGDTTASPPPSRALPEPHTRPLRVTAEVLQQVWEAINPDALMAVFDVYAKRRAGGDGGGMAVMTGSAAMRFAEDFGLTRPWPPERHAPAVLRQLAARRDLPALPAQHMELTFTDFVEFVSLLVASMVVHSGGVTWGGGGVSECEEALLRRVGLADERAALGRAAENSDMNP
ncbi:unnamed protein product [Vitrella brassicaformis CCMP3155]|uniref:Uncharacterized protein n=2 Tax=Vitrella brassicaformis TaxID=1169539 RepID=A0A0G4ECZ9_VITBC|nr:unnamed protein product [Vitrella brassicaformis CCMP3155]|eukprot:CEL93551.1 unnamed protein product [Vitrella brassicaformis CCMP3155]